MAHLSAGLVCSAATSFKKQAGTLSLYKTRRLTWIPIGQHGPADELALDGGCLSSLFSSKEGSAKVVLRVGVIFAGAESEQNLNFTFTSASSAISDREHFKNGLSDVIAHNKSNKGGNGTTSAAGSPAPAQMSEKAKGKRRAVTPDPQTGSTADLGLRMRLLKRNHDLQSLHAELVLTGQITEDEFWDGREYMLQAQQQEESQKQGRTGQMADPKPQTGDGGEVKITVTPQLIADIFAQYPVVQKAYNENCPPLTEGEFWKRYFQSKLFNRNRASSRQANDAIKDDAIFDKYLLEEEDDLEPKDLQVEHIYRLLDLAATEEDHGETGNEKDITMRAGNKRAALPLMRRFNQHSERVLNTALGGAASRSGNINAGDASSRNYEADIILEDLQVEKARGRIILDMQDRERYFEGRNDADVDMATDPETARAMEHELRLSMAGWHPDLGEFQVDGGKIEQATRDVFANLNSRHLSKTEKQHQIPEDLLRQMTSCQTSANEFLRHLWSAVLPPGQNDHSASAKGTPAQKAAKAQKMISYLQKTQDRVDLVLKEAKRARQDVERISFAMQPTLDAVQHATIFFQKRTS